MSGPLRAPLLVALALVGCGGTTATTRTTNVRPATDNRARGASVAPSPVGDPAIDSAVEAWVLREAGPRWDHVTLSAVRCGDERIVAIVWPFGREGRIEDDDTLAVPFRAVEGRWLPDGASHIVRGPEDVARHCEPRSMVMRGRRGLPPEAIGAALLERLALFRGAASREDARGLAHATTLLAELFDDEAVTSGALPDVLTDFLENRGELLSAETRGPRLHVTLRERPDRDVEEADLALLPGAAGLVMIQIPR